MNNFSDSFLLGLICTLFLFVMSTIITLGVKSLYMFYLDRIKKQLINVEQSPKPNQKPKVKKPTTIKTIKQPKKAKMVRSIEIDPEQIDKIYVKKSG